MPLNLKHMRLKGSLTRDEDGVRIAECPSIPGCVSQSETEEAALTKITSAILECLAVRAEWGMPLSVETHEIEVVV